MSVQNTLVLGTPTVDFDPTTLQLMLNRAKTVELLKNILLAILLDQMTQLLHGCGVPVIIPLKSLRMLM